MYLGFIVKEVVIKLKADSPEETARALKKFKIHKKVLYSIFGVLFTADLIEFLYYVSNTISYIAMAVYVTFDLFLVINFGLLVHFLQGKRREKAEWEGREIGLQHYVTLTLIYGLTAVHFTATALQFTNPGYSIFSSRLLN